MIATIIVLLVLLIIVCIFASAEWQPWQQRPLEWQRWRLGRNKSVIQGHCKVAAVASFAHWQLRCESAKRRPLFLVLRYTDTTIFENIFRTYYLFFAKQSAGAFAWSGGGGEASSRSVLIITIKFGYTRIWRIRVQPVSASCASQVARLALLSCGNWGASR